RRDEPNPADIAFAIRVRAPSGSARRRSKELQLEVREARVGIAKYQGADELVEMLEFFENTLGPFLAGRRLYNVGFRADLDPGEAKRQGDHPEHSLNSRSFFLVRRTLLSVHTFP